MDAGKSLPFSRFKGIQQVVAHHHLRLLGQAEQALHRGLRGPAGGQDHFGEPNGAGHLHRGLDGVGPGLGRNWPDNAGGAEDRQTAEHPQPPVEGFFRQGLTVADKNSYFQSRSFSSRVQQGLGHRRPDHLPGHRIDRRFTHRHRQTGLGDQTDAGSVDQDDFFRPRVVKPADFGPDFGAIGDIGIVARILDHRGHGRIGTGTAEGKAVAGAVGKGDLHRFRIGSAQQAQHRRLGRRRRAGPGGVTAAQRFFLARCPHVYARRSRALTAATATGVPPLRPRAVIKG